MKASQRQRYAERIEKVLEFLAERVAEEQAPSLSELAGVAEMSEYHFHRVFRLMTGETVGEAVRRVRLARALPDLRTAETVGQAVGASGYGSQQSFARAFRAQTGTTAMAVRADGAESDRVSALLRSNNPGEPAPLKIEVVTVDPFRLLAIRNVGDYAELNAGFGQLFELVLEQIPEGALQGIYGVPHDDPRFVPGPDCRFECALAVGSEGCATGPLQELTLGGGDHLRRRHLGDYDRLHANIDELYAAAILSGTREIGRGPLFVHYLDDPEQVAEADLRSDIYLPLA